MQISDRQNFITLETNNPDDEVLVSQATLHKKRQDITTKGYVLKEFESLFSMSKCMNPLTLVSR